jgi:hypothetical protein
MDSDVDQPVAMNRNRRLSTRGSIELSDMRRQRFVTEPDFLLQKENL